MFSLFFHYKNGLRTVDWKVLWGTKNSSSMASLRNPPFGNYLFIYFSCFLKENFTKNEKCCKLTHPQAIQDVDEFVSSSEQIWRNLALHHLLTIGSSAVNGCRQNESPNSW